MEMMTALDSAFLEIEDRHSALHIGSVGVFEGPAPAFADIRAEIASKLPRVPRYRQRMLRVPGNLGRPVWREDPDFDLDYHLRHTALPAPGGDAELQDLIGRIMSQPLDHDRPMWEDWVVDGLAHDRWALVTKIHHSMVDGIAGTDLLTSLFGSDAGPVEVPVAEAPGELPGPWSLVGEAVREGAVETTALTVAAVGALRHPRHLAEAALSSAGGLAHFLGAARPVSPSSLLGPLGAARTYRWAEVPLDDVLRLRTGYECTVNDVVLAVVTLAFRQLLLLRGETPGPRTVRTLVPVSVRHPDQHGHLDNRVSAILLDLPVHEVDPVSVVEIVAQRMTELKASHEAEAGDVVTTLGNNVPPPGLAAGLRLAFRLPQRVITTVTTNVPGPREELHLCGRRMVAAYPYVPIADRLRTGVAVTSYGGKLLFGLTADRQSTPDLDLLREGLLDGFAILTHRLQRELSHA